jgi:hypothetical protein
VPRGETKIYASPPTASEQHHGRTQIFHGLPAPIQRPALTVADFAGDGGPKTRLMPIEQLLKQPPPLRKGATSATGGWQSRLHLGAMPRRRKLRLVVGLISLVVSGYISLADVRASTPPVRRVTPPIAAVPAPEIVATKPEESKPVPRKAKRARESSKAASPRKAGDQLAAGDLARAAATYEQLAERAPEDPVYAEAARILRLRVGRPAP